MTFSPDPVSGTSASTGSPLPMEPQVQVPTAECVAAPMLPKGSVWSAQVGAVSPRDFVLIVAGMPFDMPGAPPATEGHSVVVRVVEDATPPVFELVTREPQAQSAALRALLSHVLRRALAATPQTPIHDIARAASSSPADIADTVRQGVSDRLATPSHDLVGFLETGAVRLDLALPESPDSHWHVEIHDTPERRHNGEDNVRATVFIDLPSRGPVEARLALTHAGLHVGLVTASEETCRQFNDAASDLTRALHAAGFPAVQISVEADPARLARDRVSAEAPGDTPPPGGLLDIRA